MKVSSIVRILLFLVILFLVTPFTQSQSIGCQSIKETSNERKEFIVMLKTDLHTNDIDNHFASLTNCLGRVVKKFDPFSSQIDSNSNEILDLSIDDSIIYIGHFSPDFANNVLTKFGEVEIVEESTEIILDKSRSIIERKNKRKRDIKITDKKNDTKITQSKTKQENLDRIDAEKGLDGFYDYPSTGGKGVNIYIVDSGVRITHKEFQGRARYGGCFIPNCTTAEDFAGHGTHVAGIAAGKTYGVAKLATIIAVRIFDENERGTTSTILKGLSYVLSAHKKDPSKKSIINMSLHTQEPISKAMERFVLTLTNNGIHVIVSAGNNEISACKQTPAAAETAITVGATDQKIDTIANFSNFGKCVDIYAPGVRIRSSYIYSDTYTRILFGTSMATPHVSGTVALIISTYGNKSPADMANFVRSLSTKNIIKGIPGNVNNFFLRVPH